MKQSNPLSATERAARIRLLALDVDGTLTDGRLHLCEDDREIKVFHALDGQGLKLLQSIGIQLALITARSSEVTTRRARELGIEAVHQSVRDKLGCLKTLAAELQLEAEQVAYIGDDLPDLAPLGWVGLAAAPANAHPWVRSRVHWISELRGGEGAVRNLCDFIVQAQGQEERVLKKFLAPT